MAILVFIMSGSENPRKATAKRPRVEHQGDNQGDRRRPNQGVPRVEGKRIPNRSSSPYLEDDSNDSDNEPLIKRTQGQKGVVNIGESSNIGTNENSGLTSEYWSPTQHFQPFTYKLYRFVELQRKWFVHSIY